MRRLRSPFLIALFHPLNVLMAGLAVVAGLVAAWWLFPIGVVLWLVMVIVVSRDPSLRMSHQMGSRDPLAPRFQRYFDRIERAQVGVFNSLSSAPPQTRRMMEPVRAEIDDLVDRAHALMRRMTALENYRLVSQSKTDLSADLEHLERMVAQAGDAVVKREYEESLETLRERIAKPDDVSTQLDRLEAQLVGLTNEMDGIVTEVVRLQAIGESAAPLIPPLVARIRERADELDESRSDASTV
jgi:hypothetical protein